MIWIAPLDGISSPPPASRKPVHLDKGYPSFGLDWTVNEVVRACHGGWGFNGGRKGLSGYVRVGFSSFPYRARRDAAEALGLASAHPHEAGTASSAFHSMLGVLEIKARRRPRQISPSLLLLLLHLGSAVISSGAAQCDTYRLQGCVRRPFPFSSFSMF